MNNINKVYIINLDKNLERRLLCESQLAYHNIKDIKYINALNPLDKNLFKYKYLYKKCCHEIKDPLFIKNNFSIGAFGCYLSHISCIEDAIQNKYETILILEDDFILINNFVNEINTLFNNVNKNWDFIYIGKKQGPDIPKEHKNSYHTNEKFLKIEPVDNYFYKPSYSTYATHGLLIRNTIFNDIVMLKNNINKPIDLKLMELYDKFNFLVYKKDLVIQSDESTDVQDIKKFNRDKIKWSSDLTNYCSYKKYSFIENIIIIGLKNPEHTHYYIHNMYYNFFKFYYPNLNTYWLSENEEYDIKMFENAIVFISPCHCVYNKIPFTILTNYIIHLDIQNNVGYKDINSFISDKKQIIENNKYIILLARETEYKVNYFKTNVNKKMICLPWFSNTLYNNLLDIKNNLSDTYEKKTQNKYFCFFGSIWNINVDMIKQLINVCINNKLYLLIKGRILDVTLEDKQFIKKTNSEYYTFIPFDYKNNGLNDTNDFDYINTNYGIKCLVTIQGNDHNNTYISNRLFESISFGFVTITNNKLAKKHFKSLIYNEDIEQLLLQYIKIEANKNEWIKTLDLQINEFLEKAYGYTNIRSLFNFLKTTNKDNILLLENNYNKYKLWFSSNKNYKNKFYGEIINNEDIQKALVSKNNYIIYQNDSHDIFLIEQIILCQNYNIYIDNNVKNKTQLVNLCVKNNKKYIIKEPLKIFCLLSGERSGSTIIIDYIQKMSSRVLALSDIFSNYNNNFTYLNSFDCWSEGMLGNEVIEPLINDNVERYFKQYEDLAHYYDFEGIFFKTTLDFQVKIEKYTYFNKIIKFISNFNVIYLTRNDLECYISKKHSEKYGHSDGIYDDLNKYKIDNVELYQFLSNKHEFINKYLSDIKNIKIIDYQLIEENTIENQVTILNNIFNYFYNSNEKYILYDNVFNKEKYFTAVDI